MGTVVILFPSLANHLTIQKMHEDEGLDAYYEAQTELPDEPQGWPGDGSGMDDFADMNANEADDYRDEGRDDEERFESDEPPDVESFDD